MNLVVRSAKADDVPGIIQAYLSSWRAGYEGLIPHDLIEQQLRLRRDHDWIGAIGSPACEVAVATDEDEVVGVVEATERPGADRDLPEITMLYVVPSWWGSSAARTLLAAGTGWIAGRGHRTARLRVVEAQVRARRFYEREGWHIDEQMPSAHSGMFPLVYYRRELLVP